MSRLPFLVSVGADHVTGDDHKRQRRILNPSFSPSHLRDILPTFFECVYRLRDAWDETLAKREHESLAFRDARHRAAYDDDGKSTVIEVYHWASRVTLDIIGSAGFGHEFGATVGKQNKLEQATRVMFGGHHGKPTPVKLALIRLTRQLFDWVPIIKFIPNKRVQEVRLGAAAFEQESRRILAAKKRDEADADKSGAITDDTFKRRKDLMALLLKSTRHDARMQLSDSELRGQMTTFLLAGHETTSTLLTWTLHRLSTRPDVQSRLRDEIRGARDQIARDGRGEFEADELNALPYLDAVTREVSRLDPPVSMTVRESAVDDVIPLSAPIRARDGSTHDAVPIKKGQIILIPIAAYNRDTAIFGDDANEFRPERWLESTKVADGQHTVGVWSPLLTFLAGPRSCIGYRFAILELKALLSALIEQYEFAPRDAAMVINARANIVIRPVIDGEDDLGYRLPLRVTRVDAA